MKVLEVLTTLRECAVEQINTPVCRIFTNPGPDAPHDSCEKHANGSDGQMWVAHMGSTAGWPSQTGEPVNCATAWREYYEIGITRCAAKIGDNQQAPKAEAITADAIQQEDDRLALRRALICCLTVEGRDLIIEDWTAIPPQGGCVGGVWTFYIRDAGCDCDTGS